MNSHFSDNFICIQHLIKRNRTKGQITIYKTLHRNLKTGNTSSTTIRVELMCPSKISRSCSTSHTIVSLLNDINKSNVMYITWIIILFSITFPLSGNWYIFQSSSKVWVITVSFSVAAPKLIHSWGFVSNIVCGMVYKMRMSEWVIDG